MPTYEYACKQCSEHLEVVQRFTDDALTECPSCQGRLRKVFGTIGISFKGSGFYKNDSRASTNGEKKKESASSGDGASSGSDTSDTSDKPKADAAAAKTDTAGKPGPAKKDKSSSTAAAS